MKHISISKLIVRTTYVVRWIFNKIIMRWTLDALLLMRNKNFQNSKYNYPLNEVRNQWRIYYVQIHKNVNSRYSIPIFLVNSNHFAAHAHIIACTHFWPFTVYHGMNAVHLFNFSCFTFFLFLSSIRLEMCTDTVVCLLLWFRNLACKSPHRFSMPLPICIYLYMYIWKSINRPSWCLFWFISVYGEKQHFDWIELASHVETVQLKYTENHQITATHIRYLWVSAQFVFSV